MTGRCPQHQACYTEPVILNDKSACACTGRGVRLHRAAARYSRVSDRRPSGRVLHPLSLRGAFAPSWRASGSGVALPRRPGRPPGPDLPGIGGPSPPPSPICGGSGIIPIPGSHRGVRALPQRLPLSARSGQGDRRPRPSESGDQGGGDHGLGIGRAAGAARLQNPKRASSERMRRRVPGGVVPCHSAAYR
jgi:hypothetical protein